MDFTKAQELAGARVRLEELEKMQEAAALEAADAKAQIIAAANAAIDEIIRASGLTYGEIIGDPLVGYPAPKAAKAAKTGGGEHPRYALIGDPNCTYSRGPVPLWMKREMEGAGLDPASKEDRETFRQTRMVQA